MVGSALKAIREELGMSQTQFAKRVGYTAKAIQNFGSERQVITTALESHARDILALHCIELLLASRGMVGIRNIRRVS